MRYYIHAPAASIQVDIRKRYAIKQGDASMKYIKIIVGLGLIALGAFIGSHISIGGGSAALLGGIAGAILYCVLDWFASRRHIRFWPSSSHLKIGRASCRE